MAETPQSKALGAQSSPTLYSYFTLTQHPLNEVHPLGISPMMDRIDEIYQSQQSLQSINLAFNTPIQILYHSSVIPLVVFHCSATKKLSFGVLKKVGKKEGDTQARDRQNSGGDLEMADNNQFISQFDMNAGEFAGNPQTHSNLPTDPLLDNPFAHSLLPQSRHPLLDLSPHSPNLHIQTLWQITSTTCPDEIHLSSNSTNQCSTDLILYVFYKAEQQLAFIKFDMLSGKFKAEHVEKEVKSIVQLQLFPKGRVDVREEMSDHVKMFLGKVGSVEGELGVVSGVKQDEMVVYKGMQVVGKMPSYELSVGMNQIAKGSVIESLSDARDSYFTVRTQSLGQHQRQVQTSNRMRLFATDDHIVLEMINILRKVLPNPLFLAIYRDIIELLLIKKEETKSLTDFEKIAGLFLSLMNKQGQFCHLQPPATPKDSQKPMQQPRLDQNQTDYFAEMIHSEFADIDDLFDDELEDLRMQHPVQAKATDNGQFLHPKSSSGKFSRSHNMLNPQQNVFEMGKQAEKDQFLSTLNTDPQEFQKHQDDIFKIFHYLYEDTKLDVLSFATHGVLLAKFLTRWVLEIGSQTSNPLASQNEVTADEFLNLDNIEADQELCRALKKIGFVNHYLADFPQIKSSLKAQLNSVFGDINQATNWLTFKHNGGFVKVEWVPDILKALQCTLHAKESSQPFIVLYERTRKVSKAFNIAFSKNLVHNFKEMVPRAPLGQFDPYLQNMYCLTSEERTHKIQSYSNVYEQLLFWLHGEGLDKDQIYNQLPSEVSLPLREALRYCKLNLAQVSTTVWPEDLYRLIGREDVIKNIKTQEQNEQAFDVDQLFGLNSQAQQQAPAEQPKSSSTLKQFSDQGSFVEFLISRFSQDSRYKEVVNLLSSSKDMTLKNRYFKNEFEQMEAEAQKEQRKKVLEKLFIKQLSKMVGRGILQFGTLEMLSTEMLQIPRISLVGQIPAINSSIQIEKREDEIKEMMQWPLFHNGAAEAMRIAINLSQSKGKQANFARNWIMQHKPATPRPEHAGFLLSLGLFGMLDCLQNTDIYQHLKSLHDSTTIGILLGKAASKIGSMDLQYTKTLCMHITYLQPPNLHADISLPVQSAAVIGAGLLYKGTRHRQITEMLLAQIGRKPINDRSIEREVYALSSGIALGMVNLGAGQELQTQLGDLNIEERLLRFIEGGKIMELPRSMLQANQNIENQQCSSIREGNQVNVHITAAGGLFALCLIYMQSNNELIASKLQMPETFHQLEYVRPSFLLQKVLARNMILWDSIEATQEWIDSQVPQIVKNIYENDIATTEKKYAQQIGGECFDFATIALCNVNITAGAVLSLGYKYAGTGNKTAASLIERFIHKLRKAKIANQMSQNLLHQIYTDQNKNLIDKYTQENCLCMAALAMSMVMAGTGDQDCFRAIRIVRKRLETNDNNYGHQMAISMALGFLFLGSGAFTLGRSKFQIACLMSALFPVFPKEPSENRFHLQATRHFWVLAVESRLLQARDVDTNEFIQTDIILTDKNKQVQRVKTPALVDENIIELELENERYFPVKMKLNKGRIVMQKDQQQPNQQSALEQVIYIKKRNVQDAVKQFKGVEHIKVQEKENIQSLNVDPEVAEVVEEIEGLLEDEVTKSFLSKNLKQEYAKCLTKMKNQKGKTFEKEFHQMFAKISGKENVETSLILENVLGTGNGSHSILDIQDTCFYIGDLFTKYLQSDSLKLKINQVIAVNEAIGKHERGEFLKEALSMDKSFNTQFTKNFNLEGEDKEFFTKMERKEPIDEEQLAQSIQSLGLLGSKNYMDTFTIQTCHVLIEMFMNHLAEKGQGSLVQSYRASIAQGQIDDNQTSQEITKNLVVIIKSVVDKSYPDQFDEGIVKRVMLKQFFMIGQSS